MHTTNHLPRAPSTPLSALIDVLQPFQDQFRRRENRTALERSLTGLLTDHPHKNGATLASVVPGTCAQQLQGLLTSMQWAAAALNRQRAEQLLKLPSAGDAVLIFNDTGVLKQGHSSVGVARPSTGTIGQIPNGQVTVNGHSAERTIAWPITTRLSLPDDWCAAAERRRTARIPYAVQFQTKPDSAWALLDKAREWGVPHACVTADADSGDNPNFLDGLETRDERSVVVIRADCHVRVAGTGKSGLQRVDRLLAARATWRWRPSRWRAGRHGWLHAQFHAVRAWRQTSHGAWRSGWLSGARPVARRVVIAAITGATVPPRHRWRCWLRTCSAGTRLHVFITMRRSC